MENITMCADTKTCKELNEQRAKAVIEGVGADAEIVTNEKGGKQSKAPMAMHLVDPQFLKEFANNKLTELEYCDEYGSTVVDDSDRVLYDCYKAIYNIASYMGMDELIYLQGAIDALEGDELQQLMKISKVLQYGAGRYKANNWRLIPEEEHINHALIHIIAHIAGDTQDNHLDHALCRLMMAYATEKSEYFEYNKYVE